MSEAGKRLSILLGKARPKGDRWHGLIGNFDGVIDVPNKPGWKYVRIPKAGTGDYELGEFPELNVAGTEYNSPVLIEYDPLTAQRVIAGGDQQAAAAIGVTPGAPDPGAYSLPKHAPLHQAGGGDPVTVSPLQISNLQLSPSATAKHVTLGAGLGVAAGTLVLKAADTDVDLTSYFPASGYKLVWITMTSAGAAAVVDPACTSFASLTLPTTINYVIGLVRLRAFQPITLLDIVDVRREWGGLVGWDVAGQGARHASDISAAVLLRHNAAPSAAGNIMRDTGAAWASVAANAYVPFAPTARGDLIAASATPVWQRLALGATVGTFLRRGAADPEWSTLILPNAATQGDLLCASGADVVGVVAAGATAGHVLTSVGAGAAPTWQAIPAQSHNSLSGLQGGQAAQYYHLNAAQYGLVNDGATAGYVFMATGVGSAPSWQANPAAGWALTGNAGTTEYTNFIGTTDDQDLVFRVANRVHGVLGSGTVYAYADGNARGTSAVDWQNARNFVTCVASGEYSVVGGGYDNTSFGAWSATIGGRKNYAGGDYSVACGRQAIVTHDGAFLFADHTAADFNSITADEFAVRAVGGFRVAYDDGSYFTAKVADTTGVTTFASVGSTPGFVFTPPVTFSSNVGIGGSPLAIGSARLNIVGAYPTSYPWIRFTRTDAAGTYGGLEWYASGGTKLWGIESNVTVGTGIEINEGATNRVYVAPGGNVGIGTTTPQKKLHVAGTILVDGDEGGYAGTTGFTDIVDIAARSTGVGKILFDDATDRDSAGFIKIYIGTTAYYVPVFAAIT